VNLAARIISIVFHPLLLATYWFAFLATVMPAGLEPFKEEAHAKFVFLIFIITFFIPLLAVGLFKTMNLVSSLMMQDRRERLVPFVFITFLYILITYLFYSQYRISLHDNVLRFMIIIDALVLVATIATFFYKLSVHSLAAWGLVGMLLTLSNIQEDGLLIYPMLATIVLAGVVMSARLQLGAHTLREVITGSVLGFAVSFVSVLLLF
jgi:membrane-associated phospholipid phosphatase